MKERKMMKKILVLGAGLVSRPHVQYLLNQPEFEVTVASRTFSKAEKLVSDNAKGKAVQLNVKDDEQLKRLISEHDLSISLLPYIYHTKIAKYCIEFGKDMVTTSYVSDEMKSLDEQAKNAGVILLNEIGVDPGIDHMSAMRVIHKVQENGGRIISFCSYCGGLPAPEANTNPWGYKFSWSPRGVIMAGKNNAKYLMNKELIEVPGTELFDHHWLIQVPGFGELETYPNRNSIPYREIYGIEDTDTIFRGTLRYPGWSFTMKKIVELCLLDDEKLYNLNGITYKEFMHKFVKNPKYNKLEKDLALQLNIAEHTDSLYRMKWLGLFSNEQIGLNEGTAMDVLCKIFDEKLNYDEGERDILILHHEFIAEYGEKRQKITSTMIDYGIPYGDTSMSRTVGLPSAIGARMIIQGRIKEIGVHIPVKPTIYKPILEELEKNNIICKEHFNEIE